MFCSEIRFGNWESFFTQSTKAQTLHHINLKITCGNTCKVLPALITKHTGGLKQKSEDMDHDNWQNVDAVIPPSDQINVNADYHLILPHIFNICVYFPEQTNEETKHVFSRTIPYRSQQLRHPGQLPLYLAQQNRR